MGLSNALFKDEVISVNLPKGKKEGVFRGISDSGTLLLEECGKIVEISSGEVVVMS